MVEATVGASDWVQKSGYEQALEDYNLWVFGPNPVYTKGDKYLFIHGNINSPAVRHGSATVGTDTIIVVHVVGVNFIIGDSYINNNQLDNERQVREALQYSAKNEDKKVFVRIKAMNGPSEGKTEPMDEQDKNAGWTDLTEFVREVTYHPTVFFANTENPDLDKWDIPMPPGKQTGAWASKVLLLKIPETGKVFQLRSHGTGVPPYQQQTDFEITVE